MKAIPVIDLMDGVVVHARRGERDAYRPLRSGLCRDADPLAVVAALLRLHPFDTLYVADLDAIRGRGDHVDCILRMRAAYPGLALWIDAGIADARALEAFLRADAGVPVLGSESLADAAVPEAAPAAAVLSLDFRAGRFLGPPALLADPGLWPADVLVMNLDRVGSDLGPDLGLLAAIAGRKTGVRAHLAGGVRHGDDLRAVLASGAAGVLLASALHDGAIGTAELAACC